MNLDQKTTETVEADASEAQGCPQCGNSMTTTWQQHCFRYGDEGSGPELTVEIPVRHCEVCGESFLDWETEEIEQRAVCEHLGVLTPEEVRQIREDYGMSRSAFSKLTGIGEASLSRWEKGSHIQNRANDRYLRLIRIPKIVDELRLIDSVAALSTDDKNDSIANFPNLESAVSNSSSSFTLRRNS